MSQSPINQTKNEDLWDRIVKIDKDLKEVINNQKVIDKKLDELFKLLQSDWK